MVSMYQCTLQCNNNQNIFVRINVRMEMTEAKCVYVGFGVILCTCVISMENVTKKARHGQ